MQKAFDLIVERLEEAKPYYNRILDSLETKKFEVGQIAGLNDAIEIVNQVAEEYKKFGNSEQSETCEWKRELITTYIKPTCVNGKYFEYEDMEYCPYCGKRIFVKE